MEAGLWQADEFVGLQRQAPAGVPKAVAGRRHRVGASIGAVHRLQEKVTEVKAFEARGFRPLLGEDQFQLVAGGDEERRAGLRADADPVNAGGAGLVPLVSMATSKPRLCSASIDAPSNCSSGSPPVQTT